MSDFECPMFHHGPWCDARCRKAYPLHAGASDCTHGPAIPPTPDPRERSLSTRVATDETNQALGAMCEAAEFWEKFGDGIVTVEIRVGGSLIHSRNYRPSDPAPAPSESVAEDDRALLFAAWLTTRPGVMTVGAGEHAGPMAEAVHEWRQAHPAPAPSEAVAWKVEERLKVGGPAYNTFWFGDDPERAARIRERAERHPHVSITPLYTHPVPARGVTEADLAFITGDFLIDCEGCAVPRRDEQFYDAMARDLRQRIVRALTPDAEGGR